MICAICRGTNHPDLSDSKGTRQFSHHFIKERVKMKHTLFFIYLPPIFRSDRIGIHLRISVMIPIEIELLDAMPLKRPYSRP